MILMLRYDCMMSNKKNAGDSHHSVHYIVEWAEKRGFKQADIARELGADKSLISRWYTGTLPTEKWLIPLAELFNTEVSGLFRHPDDDWIAKMFRNKTEEQKEAAIEMLKIFFRSSDIRSEDDQFRKLK